MMVLVPGPVQIVACAVASLLQPSCSRSEPVAPMRHCPTLHPSLWLTGRTSGSVHATFDVHITSACVIGIPILISTLTIAGTIRSSTRLSSSSSRSRSNTSSSTSSSSRCCSRSSIMMCAVHSYCGSQYFSCPHY